MTPKTVLSIVSTLGHCGPVNGMKNVARYLDPSRYRAVIATLSPEPKDSFIEDFRSLGVPVKQMRLTRTESLFIGARRLRRLVDEIGPDIVHTHGFRADILTAGAALECPVVSTVHSDLFEDYRFAFGSLLGKLAAMRQYAALKNFRAVNTVSEPLADVVSRSGIATRWILNGVELKEYYPSFDLNEMRASRAALGWPVDAVVVLHTGVLRNLKNPVEVVAGFRASQFFRSAFLAMAGDGPLRASCQLAAGTAANVAFLGRRRDVSDLLRASDVLISASSSEGLGTALLEACACGIRVIASDIPAHRYIQTLFPEQVQIFDHKKLNSVRDALDGIPPSSWHERFVPPPSVLEMISSRRMSINYQEFYSDVLGVQGCTHSCLEETVSCQSSSLF